jgi:hypothetical protein
MSVPLVFNINEFDDDGDRQNRGLLPARDQRHRSTAPLMYVKIFKRTDEIRLELQICGAQIRLPSLIATLTTAAMWLSAPTVAAENR